MKSNEYLFIAARIAVATSSNFAHVANSYSPPLSIPNRQSYTSL
jgi:hypothetical protein